MKSRVQKSQFKLFSELGKIWKCHIGFSKIQNFGSIHSPRPTFQDANFESIDKLGKVTPNLSFTVENKMGNLL